MSTAVSIVGAGWAGLAAAVSLSRQGIPVHLYDSARQLGGRARCVQLDGMDLDNGQHLMIGAYRELLQLLQLLQADSEQLLLRIPQQLTLLDYPSGATAFQLSLPRLPAPLHLLAGVLRTPSLGWGEKLSTLLRFNRLLKTPIDPDLSVNDWLAAAGLPTNYVENLLKPLCLAALTTHPDQASARALQAVLKQTFNGPRENTDLLIAKTDLDRVFPALARACIESHGGQVFTGHKVQGIDSADGRVTGIRIDGQSRPVEQLILATPATVTARLLAEVEGCEAISTQLQGLDFEPITTVYLHYGDDVQLAAPMIGLLNASAEWLFDRRVCGQPGLIAAVISGQGPHMALSNDQLGARVAGELQQLFGWPAAQRVQVIREKRGAFSCRCEVDEHRPGTQTPLGNLLLCGDYVYIEENNQPGLPSTLEGALRSGVKCAALLIKELN